MCVYLFKGQLVCVTCAYVRLKKSLEFGVGDIQDKGLVQESYCCEPVGAAAVGVGALLVFEYAV